MATTIDPKLIELSEQLKASGAPEALSWYSEHSAGGRIGIGLQCSRMANAVELCLASKRGLVLTYLTNKLYCSSVRVEDIPEVVEYLADQDWILRASISANRYPAS